MRKVLDFLLALFIVLLFLDAAFLVFLLVYVLVTGKNHF